MAAFNRTVPAAPRAALSVVTFEDGITLHSNGQTIEATHVDPAHTDSDTLVRFAEANVLHMGDTFFSGSDPFFDTSSGGRIEGMIAALEVGLGMADAETRIISGHGPLSKRDDLLASRDMLRVISERVRKSVDAGQDLEALKVSRPTREFDADYRGGNVLPERFVEMVYRSMTD